MSRVEGRFGSLEIIRKTSSGIDQASPKVSMAALAEEASAPEEIAGASAERAAMDERLKKMMEPFKQG
ncbi:MAG: hypothetical protein METHP_00051 [Methanoregula sp. SKADARSKE-2]|nr:MAG: hypothetical protein METHP_00051 [Methanoregula sp. SKADARSKE-2]